MVPSFAAALNEIFEKSLILIPKFAKLVELSLIESLYAAAAFFIFSDSFLIASVAKPNAAPAAAPTAIPSGPNILPIITPILAIFTADFAPPSFIPPAICIPSIPIIWPPIIDPMPPLNIFDLILPVAGSLTGSPSGPISALNPLYLSRSPAGPDLGVSTIFSCAALAIAASSWTIAASSSAANFNWAACLAASTSIFAACSISLTRSWPAAFAASNSISLALFLAIISSSFAFSSVSNLICFTCSAVCNSIILTFCHAPALSIFGSFPVSHWAA